MTASQRIKNEFSCNISSLLRKRELLSWQFLRHSHLNLDYVAVCRNSASISAKIKSHSETENRPSKFCSFLLENWREKKPLPRSILSSNARTRPMHIKYLSNIPTSATSMFSFTYSAPREGRIRGKKMDDFQRKQPYDLADCDERECTSTEK